MPRIICTLPNASELISNIKFAEHELGRISEEISEEVAAFFLSIPGYIAHEVKQAAAAVTVTKEELLTRAAKVGLAVKGNWGIARLKAEVEGAEEDAAEAAQSGAPEETSSAQVPASVSVTTGADGGEAP